MIQLTEKQKGKFCMIIHGIHCVFMPMELFREDKFLPLPKKVKRSTLGWYVNRKWVSYNQIKKSIKNKQHENSITDITGAFTRAYE